MISTLGGWDGNRDVKSVDSSGGIVDNVGGSGVDDGNGKIDVFLKSSSMKLDGGKVDDSNFSAVEVSFGNTTIGLVDEKGDSVENISDIDFGW